MKNFDKLCLEIINEVKKKKISEQHDLSKLKLKLASKFKVEKLPTNVDLASYASKEDREKLKHVLTIKPVRTLSGVAVVAIMSKPIECPHGKCVMCPSNVKKGVPQSYTGKEPATRRAIRNRFDPYLQVMNRLEQYIAINKVPDKAELIIMGGTFPSFPKSYQETFVKYALKAMNDFSKMFFKDKEIDIEKFKKFFELPGEVGDEQRAKNIYKKLMKLKGKTTLDKEQKTNELSDIRCVGMTFETRPDYGMLKHGNEMLRLGATRVEIGVQSVYDDVLKKIKRGHSTKETIKSIRQLKDLGFKINAHYMPGLPGVDKKRDINGLKQLFFDENYRPDMLKLYPCMVIPGTNLHKLWEKKKYKPLTTEKAAELIADFKQYVPKYVRIMRVQRDIPTYMTAAGVDKTNLRQYIEKLKPMCNCIRCREIGRSNKQAGTPRLRVIEYIASEGKEFFISIETKSSLVGFCRLRFPSESLRKEITDKSAIIRELHVYGEAVPIGAKGLVQHIGIGKRLLNHAEKIAMDNQKNKMVVISGIGVREYYQKQGYKRQGPYMVKKI